MNIKNKTNIFNLNFRSGLNNRIISSETSMDIKICENMFTEVYGVETHFCGNKSAAFANNICLKIVEKFSSKGIKTMELDNLDTILLINNCKIVGIKNKNLSEEILKICGEEKE